MSLDKNPSANQLQAYNDLYIKQIFSLQNKNLKLLKLLDEMKNSEIYKIELEKKITKITEENKILDEANQKLCKEKLSYLSEFQENGNNNLGIIKSLQDEIEAMKKWYSSIGNQKLNENSQVLKETNDSSASKIQELIEIKQQLEKKNSSLEDQIQKLNDNNQKLWKEKENKLDGKKIKIRELKKIICSKDKEIIAYKQEQELLNKRHNEIMQSKNYDFENLSNYVEQLTKDLERCKNELKKSNTQPIGNIESQDYTIKNLQQEIEILKKQNNENLTSKDNTIKNLTQESENIKRENDRNLKSKDDAIKKLKQEIEIITKQNNENLQIKDNSIRNLMQELENIKRENDRNLKSKDDAIKKIKQEIEIFAKQNNINLQIKDDHIRNLIQELENIKNENDKNKKTIEEYKEMKEMKERLEGETAALIDGIRKGYQNDMEIMEQQYTNDRDNAINEHHTMLVNFYNDAYSRDMKAKNDEIEVLNQNLNAKNVEIETLQQNLKSSWDSSEANKWMLSNKCKFFSDLYKEIYIYFNEKATNGNAQLISYIRNNSLNRSSSFYNALPCQNCGSFMIGSCRICEGINNLFSEIRNFINSKPRYE